MATVTNLKKLNPIIWIPPYCTANYTLTVESKDGTITDVTDYLTKFKIEDGATDTTGIFSFEIPTANESYNSKWTGMEIFRYYCEYSGATTATALRFRGRIEKASNKNNTISITGRSEALFVVELSVTEFYSITDTAVILKDLFTKYGNGRYNLTLIPVTSGILVNFNWVDTPFWDCIKDLCAASGYDCYVDCNLYVRYFLNGSIKNSTDAIVHDNNLIEVGDFAPDISRVKNRIRVYGATTDGVQIFYTANDYSSQALYGIRTKDITDESIITYNSAKDLAEYQLLINTPTTSCGDVTSVLLATIQPGEALQISNPLENIEPKYYSVTSFVHEYSDDNGLTTTCTINKETRKITHILRDRVLAESNTRNTSSNTSNLDFSYVNTFDLTSGVYNNTQIQSGALILIGGTTGDWACDVITSPNTKNINRVKVLLTGTNLQNITIQVSANGGLDYEGVTINTLTTLLASSGANLRVKLFFIASGSQIDSFSVQYSTTT